LAEVEVADLALAFPCWSIDLLATQLAHS
jgi:hypothetical protein